MGDQIVFFKNFNIWEAPVLFQGADAAIMVSDDSKEASATGFMKSQLNGGVIIATKDGAVPESVRFEIDGQNGFQVPYNQGSPTPEGLLKALERFERSFQSKKRRVRMVRSALKATAQVDIARVAADMKRMFSRVLGQPLP